MSKLRKYRRFLESLGKTPFVGTADMLSLLVKRHLPYNYQDFLQSPDASVWDKETVASILQTWAPELKKWQQMIERSGLVCQLIASRLFDLNKNLKAYRQQARKDKAFEAMDLEQMLKELSRLEKVIEKAARAFDQLAASLSDVMEQNQEVLQVLSSE